MDEVRAKEILQHEDIDVVVKLGLGSESAKYWTCDFSYVSLFVSVALVLCVGGFADWNLILRLGIRADKRRLS